MDTHILVAAALLGLVILGFILRVLFVLLRGAERDGTPAACPARSGGSGDEEVDRHVREGHKIEAIKRVRELTGWGLKESKEYVDRMASER